MQDDSSKDNNIISIQPPSEEDIQSQQTQNQPTSEQPSQNQPISDFKNGTINSNVNIESSAISENKNIQQPQPTVFVTDKSTTIGTVPPTANHSPGLIVLQWLTYGFWGWTVIAMSVLTVITLTYFLVSGSNVGDVPIYSVAAVLVLLPISVVCDIFYMKQEPKKKAGASSAVMIIHSVIFALFCIGALITAVFSLVNLFVSSSGSETTLVTLYSALIIFFLYALVFLRTFLPEKLFKIRRYFIILMGVIVGVFIVLAIIGPIATVQATRTDKLIENNLSDVSRGIGTYTRSNKSLPNSLNDITLIGDAKKLVADNLVTYKNEDNLTIYKYRYQLCVTYAKASSSQFNNYDYSPYADDVAGYSSSPSTYSHSAGNVCYKLVVNVF